MEQIQSEEELEKRIKELEEEVLPGLFESYTEKLRDFLSGGLFPSGSKASLVEEAKDLYHHTQEELSELKNLLSLVQQAENQPDTEYISLDDLSDLALLDGGF